MRKRTLYLLIALFCSIGSMAEQPSTVAVIPQPVKIKLLKGNFFLNREIVISCATENPGVRHIAEYLVQQMEQVTGPGMITISKRENLVKNPEIRLSINAGKHPAEGYSLVVNQESIRITGGSESGLFYGIQTLLQLMPVDINTENKRGKPIRWVIPCVDIKDHPRYSYRGMHLDVSRHFFSKDFIKRYIDLMAMYKMNTFHWHLTDDNGWRIEIKKYPELMKTGAWRVDREELPWTERHSQEPGEKATYGGYYTQGDIREIVAYAKDRYIRIIPEIEMPAHSIEVLASYPQYSCLGGAFTVPPGSYWPNIDILCAGNDSTFIFLEDVLTEVIDLFPSEYIHIGGDEADKTRWKTCPKCQERIKKEGLQDEKELQSYFIRRIEKFLSSRNRKMVGWDEILEGGLAPEATVMSWRGVDGGIKAAKMGHDVIMTPNSFCYFDYYQGDPKTEPKAIGGFITLKKVYSFEPTPKELTPAQKKHILGAQGNLWTEYIPTEKHAEYMAFPRMLALAEVVWSQESLRNWPDFRSRITKQFSKLDRLQVNYSKGSFRVEASTYFDQKHKMLKCKLESEQPDYPIIYTLDGNDPVDSSTHYTEPFAITKNSYLKAGILINGRFQDSFTERSILYHQGIGKKASYLYPYSYRYTGGGNSALVDGLRGTINHREGGWQGFFGDDLEVVIDLGEIVPVRTVLMTFLQNEKSWIFLPDSVIFSLSSNGKKFHSINELPNPVKKRTDRAIIQEFSQLFPDTRARYVKVRARNVGKCPAWHEGAGENCWLFADEIVVY